MGTLLRLVVGVTLVLAVAGVLGLAVAGGIARAHDVDAIPVPDESYLANLKADYKDAYRAPLDYNSYRDIDRLAETAFKNGGREIFRSDTELVYEGTRAGVRYFNAYYLDRSTSPGTLTLVTAVRVMSTKGKYAWKLFRPIHTNLAPYQVDRLASGAPD
jgi:hypothetical protein